MFKLPKLKNTPQYPLAKAPHISTYKTKLTFKLETYLQNLICLEMLISQSMKPATAVLWYIAATYNQILQ
jgi:hypothetical protein